MPQQKMTEMFQRKKNSPGMVSMSDGSRNKDIDTRIGKANVFIVCLPKMNAVFK